MANKNELKMPIPTWLHQEIKRITNNFIDESPYDTEDMDKLINFLEKYPPAIDEKIEDIMIQAKLDWAKSLYKTNNIVYRFPDGWSIAKITLDDLEAEENVLENNISPLSFSPLSFRLPSDEDFINNSHFFSLRDPYNTAKAYMHFYINPTKPNTLFIIDTMGNINEINEYYHNDDFKPIPEYQARIKKWMDTWRNNFNEILPEDEDNNQLNNELSFRVDNDMKSLPDINWHNYYGVPLNIYTLGGNQDNYLKAIQESENAGWGGSYFYKNTAYKIIATLVMYAQEHNELPIFEDAFEHYADEVYNRFNDYILDEMNMSYPQEDDFMILPDKSHPELPIKEKDKSIQGEPIFDEESYNKAVKEYEEKERQLMEIFEPMQFSNYTREQLEIAKNETKNKKIQTPDIFMNKKAQNKMKIYKIAKKEDKIPDAETLALYINVLNLYLQDNPSTNKELKNLIEKLPSSRQVQKSFSFEECRILYETIGYLWKIITGNDILEESKISRAPETLVGNYWMLKNGILLHGVNHFTIIKQNTNLFISLLNIGGFALQQYLHSRPNELIKFIIKNGGARLFVPKDRKRLFAQMSPETYTKWGKSKIKKMDFPNKTIKIIDNKAEFNGWKSGIVIKL